MSESNSTNGRRVVGLEVIQSPRTTRDIEVAGVEGVFKIQELTYDERMSAVLMGRNGDAKRTSDDRLVIPRVVAQGWINDDGSRVVPQLVGGGEQIAKLPSRVLMALYEGIAELSGFAAESRAEVGKD